MKFPSIPPIIAIAIAICLTATCFAQFDKPDKPLSPDASAIVAAISEGASRQVAAVSQLETKLDKQSIQVDEILSLVRELSGRALEPSPDPEPMRETVSLKTTEILRPAVTITESMSDGCYINSAGVKICPTSSTGAIRQRYRLRLFRR